MAGLVVGATLIASLLLVHFSLRARPMSKTRPLDVDSGLPLPEAGQASTVFSLTALFGAYLGVYLLLGLPALAGLASGTVFGLWFLNHWIERSGAQTFEDFALQVLGISSENSTALALGLAGIQCAFATSEMLILREVADVALGVRADQATLLVVALIVVAYFYVLFGGYMAVFRTDVLQFSLVAAMGVVVLALTPTGAGGLALSRLIPRPGYWTLLGISNVPTVYAYQFLIGVVMGFGFIVASPDAWKRVFLVSAGRSKSRLRFAFFALVGAAPFMLLIPMAAATNPIPDGPLSAGAMWAGVLNSNAMFVATSLGLIASFLSSFNGALLLSVHFGLLNQRRQRIAAQEIARFHWLMTAALLTVFFLFYALRSFENPYILANLLLGPYALVAGTIVGIRTGKAPLPRGSLLWIFVAGGVGWLMYFTARIGFPEAPTTYQVNSVPAGALLFALTATICWSLTHWRRRS